MVDENDVENFLNHHGVKGMKWGVINEDNLSSDVQKTLDANPPRKLSTKETQNVAASKAKHNAHFEKSDSSTSDGHWKPTKKQVAVVAIGAIAAAAIIYKVKTGNSAPEVFEAFSKETYMNLARDAESPAWLNQYAGKKMDPTYYGGVVQSSVSRVWNSNHVTKECFAQGEITFPKGHQFYRLSHAAEKGFAGATYTIPSEADLARYMGTSEFGNKTKLIKFAAETDIKIPDLHTRLNAMHKVLIDSGAKKVKPQRVFDSYSELVGGKWDSVRAKKFFAELEKQGFHGIIDDMDAGVYGEKPLVMFGHGLSGKTSSDLTEKYIKQLLDTLVEIPNRR